MTDLQRVLDTHTAAAPIVGSDGELPGTGCPFCDAFEEEREQIHTHLLLADRLLSTLRPPDDDSQRLVLAIRNRIADAMAAYRRLAGL